MTLDEVPDPDLRLWYDVGFWLGRKHIPGTSGMHHDISKGTCSEDLIGLVLLFLIPRRLSRHHLSGEGLGNNLAVQLEHGVYSCKYSPHLRGLSLVERWQKHTDARYLPLRKREWKSNDK